MARDILWKLLAIIFLGLCMKISSTVMFIKSLDPYWFFYLTVFPIFCLMYELSNPIWIELAKISGSPQIPSKSLLNSLPSLIIKEKEEGEVRQ